MPSPPLDLGLALRSHRSSWLGRSMCGLGLLRRRLPPPSCPRLAAPSPPAGMSSGPPPHPIPLQSSPESLSLFIIPSTAVGHLPSALELCSACLETLVIRIRSPFNLISKKTLAIVRDQFIKALFTDCDSWIG